MRSVWLTLAVLTFLFLPVNSVLASEDNNSEELSITVDSDANINVDEKEASADLSKDNEKLLASEKEVKEVYTLTVSFVSDDGKKIKDDLVLEKENNSSYNIEIPSIDDYIFVDSDLPLSGVITSDTLITLTYKVDETIDLDDSDSEDKTESIKDESNEVITDGSFMSFASYNDSDEEFTNPDTIDNIDIYLGTLFITFNLVFPLLITKRYYL